MSSPEPVLNDRHGVPVVFWSLHDQNCDICGAVTHVGFDTSAEEYPQTWLCVACLIRALAACRSL